MNDDPIKLRDALFAAEPFLTYLFKEATADRNSKHLEDALNKVRGALGMPTVTKAKRSLEVDLEANTSDVRIELVRLTENEDGSAIATFDLNQDAVKLLTKVGLLKLLTDAAAAYAEQDDAQSKA